MSKYTTELRWFIESGGELGLKDYPIFNEDYRETLNSKIIEHYYFREIGFETIGLFKRFLNRTMNEIMPYYNQLYESQMLKIDPLKTIDYVETLTRNRKNNDTRSLDNTDNRNVVDDNTNTVNGESDVTSSSQSSVKNVESDTPQGLLAIGNIENQIYATNANIGQDSESGTSKTTQKTTDSGKRTLTDTLKKNEDETYVKNEEETYTRNESGFRENQSEMLLKYRQTFLNIDMMIIEELQDLFMGLY